MKTNLFILVAISFLMINCSSEEISDYNIKKNDNNSRNEELIKQYNSPNVIKFIISNTSRGTVTDNNFICNQNNGFGFFGYQTDETWAKSSTSAQSSFMHNLHAIYTTVDNNSFWCYGTPKIWPADKMISFFAYAPYATSNNGITVNADNYTDAPIISYDTNIDDLTKMTDIVTDCRDDIKDLTSIVNNGVVNFRLTHIMSSLNIKARLKNEITSSKRLFITELKITPASDILSKKAKYNFATDSWTNESYINSGINLSSILNLASPTNAGNFTTSSVEIKSTSDTKLFKDEQKLYFIPVNNENGTSNNEDIKLDITYCIVSNGTSTVKNKVVSFNQGFLAKGKTNSYVLVFDIQSDEISINAIILPWNTSNENLNI